MTPSPPISEPSGDEARRVFLAIAILTWVLWGLIAAGVNGESDGDSRAWLTGFTFWAPASYLFVVGRRPWARRTAAQTLLIAAACVAAAFETLTVAAHARAARPPRPSIVDRLPPVFGVAILYGALASLFLAPLLSLVVFLQGRRKNVGPPP